MRDGRPEQRHRRVADELLHGAAEPLELRAEALVVRAQDGLDVLGIQRLCLRREVDKVREQHRHDLPFAAGRRHVSSLGRQPHPLNRVHPPGMTRTRRARCSPHWDGSLCRDGVRGVERRPAPRDPARDGDVRARRRHVADERVDLGGRARPRHDRERRAVGDRARGARLGRVHPDRQQDRRPDRPQARVRPRPARLRDRRAVDDARAEPAPDRHLLGDHRRPRRVAAAAVDAVADPRQLRGRDAAARPTRSSARPRRSPPPSGR